jgi:TolA-binding protein
LFLPTTQYIAERAHAEGEVDLAARLFKRMTAEGTPQEYVAKGLAGLGKTQLKGGDAAASADTFAELLEMAPERTQAAEAALLRARSLEAEQQHDAALAAYLLVLEDFEESQQAPWAMFSAAKLHEKLRQHREAVVLLERLASHHPEFPHLDAVLYRLAWVQMELDRHSESDGTFRRLVRDFKDSRFWGDAVYRQAERAFEAGDFAEAVELVDKLIQRATDSSLLSHALYLKGKIAAQTARWAEVLAAMQRLVSEFPESTLQLPARYWTAESLYRLEQFEEAGVAFEELSIETGGRDDTWLAMVPLRRAQVLAQQHEWEQAQKIAAGIAQRFPDFRQQYEVDYLLGRCLSNRARFSEAREAYLRVVRSPTGGRTETAAMAQWMIGESYFHQKEYDLAIRAYHRVESLYAFPRWQAAALLQAGKCHELKQEWKQALRLYAQLLKEYPQTPFAEDASKRLKQLRVTDHTTPDATDAL